MKKMVVIGLMCMIGLSTMACKSNQKEPFVPKVVENSETVSFASQDGISVFADVYYRGWRWKRQDLRMAICMRADG